MTTEAIAWTVVGIETTAFAAIFWGMVRLYRRAEVFGGVRALKMIEKEGLPPGLVPGGKKSTLSIKEIRGLENVPEDMGESMQKALSTVFPGAKVERIERVDVSEREVTGSTSVSMRCKPGECTNCDKEWATDEKKKGQPS